jgi:hypothetical protein
MNVLTLARAESHPTAPATDASTSIVSSIEPFHYLDMMIDGVSLSRIVGDSYARSSAWPGGPSHAETGTLFDLIPVLVGNWATDFPYDKLRALLVEDNPGLPRRITLFVCPLCGEHDCGEVSGEMVVDQQTIVWRNFIYEYVDGAAEPPVVQVSLVGLDVLTFEVSSYRTEIRRAPALAAERS